MIRFSANMPDGRLVLGVGLSNENLRRLAQGHPIAFPLEPMGGAGELVIFTGDTEESMRADLVRRGVNTANVATLEPRKRGGPSPDAPKEMWSCGHIAAAVCGECHADLIQRANHLAQMAAQDQPGQTRN